VLLAATLLFGLLVVSCSGGGSDPVSPLTNNDPSLTGGTDHGTQNVNPKQLWGYFDLHFDLEAGTVEAVSNRSATFNLNAVTFLNGTPNMLFNDLVIDVTDPNVVGVTLDVGLVHPLPLDDYRGYDVMGVGPMGQGSGTLAYNGGSYPVAGTDQTLNNPDGFTRWFNAAEFLVPGVLGYTPGSLATGGYTPTATINHYKLFADGLGPDDEAFTFVCDLLGFGNNAFVEAATNFRHYDISFPVPDPNVTYGYAVVASWGGETEEFHPTNTPEVVAITATQTEDMYYVDGTENGGNLVLDFSLAGYGEQPSTIYIETDVLSSVFTSDSYTISVGGAETYSTYHVEIPADNLTGNGVYTAWIIAEYGGYDYSNDFGVPNDASDDPLAAYFQINLTVLDEAPIEPCTEELAVLTTGSIPDTGTFPISTNEKAFCVVGDNTFNRAGVYYMTTGYGLRQVALDYSANNLYMTLQGNYGFLMPSIIGPEANGGSVEVDPSGGVMMLSRDPGPFFSVYLRNECASWWGANNPILNNATTLNSFYGRVYTRDCSTDFNAFGRITNHYGLRIDTSGDNQCPGFFLSPPYGVGDYGASFQRNWAPADKVTGSADGLVSNEDDYIRFAVDSLPQNVPGFDVIYYYLEGNGGVIGAGEANDIEVFRNITSSGGLGQSYLTTIQAASHVGTAMDICVLNVFGAGTGQDPDATGNWLLVLEDNGDNTWQVAAYQQDGTFISRSETQDGDPWGMDVDHANRVVHVWFDDAGTASYTTMQWVNCP
jgi:hypothetical protein